jgi:hypothetical protein
VKLDAPPADSARRLAKVAKLGRLSRRPRSPTADAPIVERQPGSLRITIGGVEWLRAEGLGEEDLTGEAKFLQACLGLEGLPAAVRAELAKAGGFPRRLVVRCATPATEVACAVQPACSARSTSQSISTPPPWPPRAITAM